MKVRSSQTRQSDHDQVHSVREQKLDQEETVRHKLGGNGDYIEVGILTSLILRSRVTQSDQQCLHVGASTGD